MMIAPEILSAQATGNRRAGRNCFIFLSLCSSVLTQFHPLGRDLRLVITFSRCGDKLQECMEENGLERAFS